MYAGYIARLLAPLGVYDLREESVSGAMVAALGEALDEAAARIDDGLADAFLQSAGEETLTRWERTLPLHGVSPDPEARRGALLHLLGQPEVCCSAGEIAAALAACGVDAALEMTGPNLVTVSVPPGTADNADLNLLIRSLVPAHLGIRFAESE